MPWSTVPFFPVQDLICQHRQFPVTDKKAPFGEKFSGIFSYIPVAQPLPWRFEIPSTPFLIRGPEPVKVWKVHQAFVWWLLLSLNDYGFLLLSAGILSLQPSKAFGIPLAFQSDLELAQTLARSLITACPTFLSQTRQFQALGQVSRTDPS